MTSTDSYSLSSRIRAWNSVCQAHREAIGTSWEDADEVLAIQSEGIRLLCDADSVRSGVTENQRIAMTLASTHALSLATATYGLALRGQPDAALYLRRGLYDLRAVGPALSEEPAFATDIINAGERRESLGAKARSIMSAYAGFSSKDEYRRFQSFAHTSRMNFAMLIREGGFMTGDPISSAFEMVIGAGVRNNRAVATIWLETLIDHALITLTLDLFLPQFESKATRLHGITTGAVERLGKLVADDD